MGPGEVVSGSNAAASDHGENDDKDDKEEGELGSKEDQSAEETAATAAAVAALEEDAAPAKELPLDKEPTLAAEEPSR